MPKAALGELPQFHFSAKAFPKRQRVAAWREIFGRTVVNLDIEPTLRDGRVLLRLAPRQWLDD
jgi:hypothetical protein